MTPRKRREAGRFLAIFNVHTGFIGPGKNFEFCVFFSLNTVDNVKIF